MRLFDVTMGAYDGAEVSCGISCGVSWELFTLRAIKIIQEKGHRVVWRRRAGDF